MARHTEGLDGGLLDGPDPATLKIGQLSYVQNAVYKSNAPALQRARGRVTFGTATATASDINGLRDMQFDISAGHYLLAQVSGVVPAYVTAFVGDTGTFGVLTTNVTAGSALDRVQYLNRFYAFNGATVPVSALNSNKVFYLSATAASSQLQVRQHGMLPVNTTPFVGISQAAVPAVEAIGFYEYWTTEVAVITQDGAQLKLESTFVGTPYTFQITDLFNSPAIQMPSVVNPITTHWRVYRSPKKDTAAEVKFPAGFLIAEQSTATAQVYDTKTNASDTGYVFPTSYNSGSDAWHDAVNPTNLGADDNTYATLSITSGPFNTAYQGCYGMSFGAVHGAIAGIEVTLEAYISVGTAPVQMNVQIGRRQPNGDFQGNIGAYDSGAAAGKAGLITSTAAGTPTTLVLGSSTDKWFSYDPQHGQRSFLDTDITSNFMIQIGIGGTVAKTVSVDYVKIKVFYSATFGTTVPFPTVIYEFGEVVAQVGRNGPPPSARTADLYQGSLVTNDESNASVIRWSSPEAPEYFPSTYYVDMETDDNDAVTLIKVVNNRLIVCLTNSTWRFNYLPSERDASFDRGKCFEPISNMFGCINPMCGCVFSTDTTEGSTTQWFAWVSSKGIHITDGFSMRTLTQNLNWRNILSISSTSQAIALINDAENQELLFYYRNDALGNESYKCLHLNYSSQHMGQDGKLKISGKVNMRNYSVAASARADLKSAWAVPRTNGDTSLYLGYGSATAAGGGMVYRESGATIPAEDPTMGFITRRMFLAGEGSEFRGNELYSYVGTNTGTAGVAFTYLTTKTNDDGGEVTQTTKTISYGGKKLGKTQFRQVAEGLRVSASVTGNPNNDVSIEYLAIDGEDFGQEDSGK